jgi:hypothetical protein
MATTTNYSWTTPDDTDLVKDGAAAIRTLGSSVDTTTKNLNPETTLGDIAYRSSTANVKTRLGLGTAGQVLTVNSGATAPEWATASAGGLTLISETVASANSSISLSGIAGTYKQLLLTWSGIRHSGTGSEFSVRFNNDSGTNYSGGNAGFSGATLYAGLNTKTSVWFYVSAGDRFPFGRNTFGSGYELDSMGTILIDNYASTSKYKFYTLNCSFYDNTDAAELGAIKTGLWKSTSAITSIDIVRLSGAATISNTANTSIRLYGVS